MRNIYKILALALLALPFTSCKHYLDEDPKGQLMSTSAFSQPSDLDGAVHALQFINKYVGHYNSYFSQSLLGDDINSISTKTKYLRQDCYEFDDADDLVTDPWWRYWLSIKAANFIINGGDKTPGVTEDQLNRDLGIAYFWRGYWYFFLVRTFGKLPMNIDNSIDLEKDLSSEEEIYEQIVSDLKTAEEMLPMNYDSSPWATNGYNIAANKAAAQATLAQVYLTMAGWPLKKGQEYYTLAATEAYPQLVTEMTGVGEQTGELEHTLEVVSDYYDFEVQEATARAIGMLEPITIVLLAGVVCLILLAVYLPMFSIYGDFNSTM